MVDKGGKRYLFSGDSIYLNGVLSLINCYGSTMEGYRQNIGKLAGLNVEALIPSHFRLTLSAARPTSTRPLRRCAVRRSRP